MDVLYPCCCSLDVNKRTVVTCLIYTPPSGPAAKTVRTFGTMTNDLLALAGRREPASLLGLKRLV